ncbi:MAG: molecular chaperone SurA, partial [Alcaligenaceae bacterium]|nr:molecular chaperone SurA [Alcaligenaceae bacterium]
MRRVQINRRLAALLVPVVGLCSVISPASAQTNRASQPQAAQAQRFADGIAAVVNKRVITLHQVDTEVQTVRKQLAFQKIEAPDAETLRRQVLQRMITEELIRQEAKRMGVAVSDQELDQAVATIAQRNKMSVAQLRTEIQKTGVNWSYYLASLRQEILTDAVRQRAVDSRIL